MRVLKFIIILIFAACTSQNNSKNSGIDLSNQKLYTIPDSIYTMYQLEYLCLGNSFTIYPPLSALPVKNLLPDNANQITQIAENISQLQHLKTLIVNANDLKSLPKGLMELKMLETLDISFNNNLQLNKELEILTQITSLKYLNITRTNFDQLSVDVLKKSLPATRIIIKEEERLIQTL